MSAPLTRYAMPSAPYSTEPMMASGPAVYTVASGAGFLDALAAEILRRHGSDAFGLSDCLILLPNRRAQGALMQAFLRAGGGSAALLPRIRALGDVDSAELDLGGPAALDLPPRLDEPQRLLALATLIDRWAQRTGQDLAPASRLDLARSLSDLIDSIATEGLNAEDLDRLVPDDLARHWQISLTLLSILMAEWPAFLQQIGRLDPAAHRDRLIRAQAAAWVERPPLTPVYVAGSTGTIPATADLMARVLSLPQGAVVLPGLDREMDAAAWAGLDETHPQHAMKQLLDRLGLDRATVRDWPLEPACAARADAVADRLALLRLGLSPPDQVHRWADRQPPAPRALDRVDLADQRREAGYIALRMREALETPGRTAALVTPDRGLARRVRSELSRWGLDVDDSAGEPLGQTRPGRFVRLMLAAAQDGFRPVALLSLLKHPLCAPAGDREGVRRLARTLERRALRGVRPAAGLDALAKTANTALKGSDVEALSALIDQLGPLEALVGGAGRDLAALLDGHRAAAEALAGEPEALWAGEAGEALALMFADWQAAALAQPVSLAGRDYPALFDTLMAGQTVRPHHGGHARLSIWGPIEARLQQADLMILGGLNDGVWPPFPETDPWMSRDMRARFGLPPVTRRTGQSAHDFVEAAAAPEAVLTRARKVDRAPAVASRWLTRLAALGLEPTPEPRLAWLTRLERPAAADPGQPPEPRPPIAARPKRLSVTQVERWMRDPYGLYAAKILRLPVLDPLEADPAGGERGEIIHQALETFYRGLNGHWPEDALDRLLVAGREAFEPWLDRPAIATFWWPRFERIAEAVVAEEGRRRALGHRPLLLEADAELNVGGFILTARADRLDRLADGRLEILDYKTGQVPDRRRVAAGYAPQLPLEGLMAERGAFTGRPETVGGLAFWKLTGGAKGLEIHPVKDQDARIAQAEDGLRQLIARFNDPQTPYLSQPQPDFAAFGDYDHLARLAEWQDRLDGEEAAWD